MNQVPLDPTIFESLEALDDYLATVRTRREQRRQARIEAERLCVAVARVKKELDEAQQDDDTDIVLELQAVLAEFERRLAEALLLTVPAGVQVAPAAAVEKMPAEEPFCATELITAEAPNAIPEPIEVESASEAPAEEELAPEVVVVSAEEREEQVRNCLAEIEALGAQWNDLDKEGLRQKDRFLNRPACFRMRSLACSLARIQTQAEASGVLAHIDKAVTGLRDKMELARTYAGDTCAVLPFDQTAWADADSRLCSADWEELAHLYRDVAQAQEVWDWYYHNREDLSKATQLDLLNAVGAAQQMLFRTLDDYRGSDRLQGDLYGSLREEAVDHVGYLVSLNADMTWEQLEALAQTLSTLLSKAKQEAEGTQEKREKATRKTAALQAVLQWQKESTVADSEDEVAAERTKLLPLLDACMDAGIPPTNVQVRGALLHAAPALLKDQPAYAKFLAAVLDERKRKGMDVASIPESADPDDEADLPDAQVTESKELVRLILEGQKVLILGGSARQQVAQRLKEVLGCADVAWTDSKKGDRMSKFKTPISRADVVIVVKNFASHEMSEKGREWAKEYGKLFVLLPGGYGVNQIINQMYLQLVQSDPSPMMTIPSPKAGIRSLSEANLT